MKNSANRYLWLRLAVFTAFAAVLVLAGCSDKSGNTDPCADNPSPDCPNYCLVNPTAQGCPDYCPSTQQGCPGYVDPGTGPGAYCGVETGDDFTESQDGLNINMVFVKCGSKRIGCTFEEGCDNNERYAHTVNISSYYIGKYPVTQRQWKVVTGTNTSHFVGDDRPVETVSWEDAQEFLRALNAKTGKKYRLPTNAEWEYAARGGTKSNDYLFPGSGTVDDVAWHRGNSVDSTRPVGAKLPNELGLYDMSGNVFEWVNDWWEDRYPSEQPIGTPYRNPQGPETGTDRVMRGGSYNQTPPQFFRVSARTKKPPAEKWDQTGFRLALTAE